MCKITIDESQELRKQGFYTVTNHDITKVLLVTKNEDEAYNYKIEQRNNNKIVKVWSPLTKFKISDKDYKQALKELRLGLNCRSI